MIISTLRGSDLDQTGPDPQHWKKKTWSGHITNFMSIQKNSIWTPKPREMIPLKMVTSFKNLMSDIAGNFSPISDCPTNFYLSVRYRKVRYRLSPISLITDIGLSAHLCFYMCCTKLLQHERFAQICFLFLFINLKVNINVFLCVLYRDLTTPER
jgi:hypothetical protein